MKQFSKFSTAKIQTGSIFDPLPKGAYVLTIMRAEEEPNKNGSGSHIKVAFDIAEGEYAGFYKKQLDAQTGEDKHWPYDGIYNLSVPDDNSPQWMIDKFGTFVAALEDSNDGYHWDWDEKKWTGKVIGGLFRIEQSQAGNGTVYDHTRLMWVRKADDVRNKRYGRLPNDKPIAGGGSASAGGDGNATINDFVSVASAGPDEIPF